MFCFSVGSAHYEYILRMVKRKQHDECLPFSSDDEINSDDFDSDSDSNNEQRCERNSVKVVKKRNKYVAGLYSALGITDKEVEKLKDDPSDTASRTVLLVSSSSSSKSFRQPPEIIVFDDPSKRHKFSFLIVFPRFN